MFFIALFATCALLTVPLIRRVSSCPVCGDGESEQRSEQGRSTTKKMEPVPLVQVCEHQRTLCFVDVVASHARHDTESLHLSSSLTYIARLFPARVWLRVPHRNRITCTEFKVHITLYASHEI